MTSRAFSPPDRTRQFFSTSSPEIRSSRPAPAASLALLRERVLQRLEHRALTVEQIHGVLGE